MNEIERRGHQISRLPDPPISPCLRASVVGVGVPMSAMSPILLLNADVDLGDPLTNCYLPIANCRLESRQQSLLQRDFIQHRACRVLIDSSVKHRLH
jgi:hypothetical protein